MKTLTELLIEWDTVNKKLDKIQNDPTYIDNKVKEVFGNKKYTPDKADIKKLLEAF